MAMINLYFIYFYSVFHKYSASCEVSMTSVCSFMMQSPRSLAYEHQAFVLQGQFMAQFHFIHLNWNLLQTTFSNAQMLN